MWEVAKKQDNSLKVAVVYSWPWIGQFVTDETVDFSYDCNGNDKECADKVREVLQQMYLNYFTGQLMAIL